MKKPISMWFKKMVDKYGPNFLESVNADELRRTSNMFFKDMMFGSIDKQKQSYVFFDKRFMDIMINTSYALLCQHSLQYDALISYANCYNDINNNNYYQLALTKNAKLRTLYSTIYNALVHIAQSGDVSVLDLVAVNSKALRHEI